VDHLGLGAGFPRTFQNRFNRSDGNTAFAIVAHNPNHRFHADSKPV
jgi:hypothetical protein